MGKGRALQVGIELEVLGELLPLLCRDWFQSVLSETIRLLLAASQVHLSEQTSVNIPKLQELGDFRKIDV